jgi:phytoene synthase
VNRQGLVDAAKASIDRGSQSFAAASRLFDPMTRERAWLLYAWCRACDDLADGQDHGHALRSLSDSAERIATIQTRTRQALGGEATGDPPFDALALVVAECAIPAGLPFDVIEGFALDAAGWRPRSEADLFRYCYHVAGAVGVMMALVMGVSPDDAAVLDRACDLGLAFQLGNIARDVAEDAAGGRCYLPQDWLDEEGIAVDRLMDSVHREGLARLATRLANRAAAYEASARIGAKALPYRSAWAVLAAAGIYGGIARAVAARGVHAWDTRVSTSKGTKLGWVARAAVQAALRHTLPASPRSPRLWTRERRPAPAGQARP